MSQRPMLKVNLRFSGCGRVTFAKKEKQMTFSHLFIQLTDIFLSTCFIPDIDNEEDTWINGF